MPPKNDTPSAVRKLCFPRTVPVSWSSGLRLHMQGSQEWQAPVGWPLGSISTIGNQVKNQLTHCSVGAECRDFPAPQSQPRDTPQEAINSIYRGIIGHLQNQAFPRKWGRLFDSQCKRNQWGSVGQLYKTYIKQKGKRGSERWFKSLPYSVNGKGISHPRAPTPSMVSNSNTAFFKTLKGYRKLFQAPFLSVWFLSLQLKQTDNTDRVPNCNWHLHTISYTHYYLYREMLCSFLDEAQRD